MSIAIDWEKLAATLGLLTDGGGEQGSSDAARRALELILGEDTVRASVDYYIATHPGAELARSVLWQLHPWSGMNYCYEIFKSSRDIKDRRLAVELLRVIADRRTLAWIAEFLNDADADIQVWGVGILDQLLWSHLIEPVEAEELLRRAARHGNEMVRERAEFIRSYLQSRAARDEKEFRAR